MSGLSRNVIKWLQSLDLTYQIKNPKWDMSNGFCFAEILSCYYPLEIQMFSFNNGQSLQSKMLNWSVLKKFIVTKNINISIELIDACMHCKEGASILLIEQLYQCLTNRHIQKATPSYEQDLSDWPYQQQLPLHARATAVQTIKNNFKTTEMHTDPSLKYAQNKIEKIIRVHKEHRLLERDNNPERFDKKLTLAERALRRPVEKSRVDSSITMTNNDDNDYTIFKAFAKEGTTIESSTHPQDPTRTTTVQENESTKQAYKEIRVKQDSYTQSHATTVN